MKSAGIPDPPPRGQEPAFFFCIPCFKELNDSSYSSLSSAEIREDHEPRWSPWNDLKARGQRGLKEGAIRQRKRWGLLMNRHPKLDVWEALCCWFDQVAHPRATWTVSFKPWHDGRFLWQPLPTQLLDICEARRFGILTLNASWLLARSI